MTQNRPNWPVINYAIISATTVGTDRGRLILPTFRLRGTNNVGYWSPNFLAVVFKKQEISLQVLFHNFHLFFGSTTRGATTAEKLKY